MPASPCPPRQLTPHFLAMEQYHAVLTPELHSACQWPGTVQRQVFTVIHGRMIQNEFLLIRRALVCTCITSLSTFSTLHSKDIIVASKSHSPSVAAWT
eukprot:Skav220213  [mRNA]  locus=scaffold1600:58709:59002:+ [translate_table: standard]